MVRESLYRREAGAYALEGVSAPPVTWWDNNAAVGLIESVHRPAGIFEILDDASLYNLPEAYVIPGVRTQMHTPN